MYRSCFKRLIDFVVAFVALLVLSPILIIVTIWLHYANKGSGAFFLHSRAGWHNKIFKVIKFKTMTDERDAEGNLLPDGQRLTKVGRFVRSTSLDELPQLVNVLKGDMSLIGPRPLYDDFLKCYNDIQIRRHEVRPGITGWAQVNGRNFVKYSKKFEYDVWYVDHISFLLDLKILWMTFLNVIKRDGVGEGEVQDELVDDLGFGEKLRRLKES
ncbi:sugar transferase [Prevotella melaninogenica]|jgi:bacterial sugar transferase|nr:sugar transferase [Prevotella sp.]MBF1602150.1 sugar transferase [Prevotella sp.]MBF1611641.1 sugar transferase [Prevotella sp.]